MVDNPGVSQALVMYLRQHNLTNRDAINTLRQVNRNFKNSLQDDFEFVQNYIDSKPRKFTVNDWLLLKPELLIEQNERLWGKNDYSFYTAIRLYATYKKKYNFSIPLDNFIDDIYSQPGLSRWVWNHNKTYFKNKQTADILRYTSLVNKRTTKLRDFYNWVMEFVSMESLTANGI